MDTKKKASFRVILKDLKVKNKKDKELAKKEGRRFSATFTVYQKDGKSMSFEEFVKAMDKKISEI